MAIGAIDIGGTKTITAILSDSGEILVSRHFSTESSDWHEHFALTAKHFKTCEEMHKTQTLGKDPLVGVGINVPGMTDNINGILIYAPHQNWYDVPVRDYFRSALSIQNVQVENDVNSCALGEMVFGGGGSDFLWLTISTGNGGAIVANSKLIRGFSNCAGEFGHVKVEFDHPRLCACGQRGCLESQSSGTAIKEIFLETMNENPEFLSQVKIFEKENRDFKRDASGLALLANEGNPTARALYRNVGKYLGRAISYGLNISNPEIVYLGGGVAKSLQLFLPELLNEIDRSVVPGAKKVEIRETMLGYNAALLGAGSLIKLNL